MLRSQTWYPFLTASCLLTACQGNVNLNLSGLSGLNRVVSGGGASRTQPAGQTSVESHSSRSGNGPAVDPPNDALPRLVEPTEPTDCPRPKKGEGSTVYRDQIGYSIPNNTLISGVTIDLEKGESISVGGSSCVHFDNVIVKGGDISIGGRAKVVLRNVRVEGGRDALSVGGAAHVTVDGGSYQASTAASFGGSAVVKLDGVALSGPTALSLGGDANVLMQDGSVQCDVVGAFDECVSAGGSAILRLDDVRGTAQGRALSVGGEAFVIVDGGTFKSKEPIHGAAAFDVMGAASLVMIDVTLQGTSSVNDGGDGKVYIRGGHFRPGLVRNGRTWAP